VLHSLGVLDIATVPSYPGAVADGINAVMMILPRCFFDEKKCANGLKSLRAYRREWNEGQQVWRSKPVHDWASDDADAFRMLAMGAQENAYIAPKDAYRRSYGRKHRGTGWAA
jgi:hypothetical protein